MIDLRCDDCLRDIDVLSRKLIVVTDPPYGCHNDCDYTRFTKNAHPEGCKNFKQGITGDDTPFDPTPWLAFNKVVLWGYQFFAARLPVGTILVWNKRRESKLGKFMSDCELAWVKGGKGVYLFNHIWDGFDRASERGIKTVHPSQKPVALMRWCIERVSKVGDTILDPYMGSGTTGIAALELGRNFIGYEVNREYFEIAQRRIAEAQTLKSLPPS